MTSNNRFSELQDDLKAAPKKWLVTGAAGFIGSNLVETLLRWNQTVVGLDNFSTGFWKNLDQVKTLVTPEQWSYFSMLTGDIRDARVCQDACSGVDYVLHQGARGSVPFSIENPIASHESNVTGTLNMLLAARDAKVRRFVYASSSSIYGDDPGLPKIEDKIGEPLSPYAATKRMDEIYARVFALNYGMETIGLRYFNVFGPRQDPDGAYAAVIPKWIAAMLKGRRLLINGDGETSRDFCYIANVVQANLLAATASNSDAVNQAYNVAVGERTTLNQLHGLLCEKLINTTPGLVIQPPVYQEFRAGDVRHSLADISKARRLLGYAPTHQISAGLDTALAWYKNNVV